MPADYWDDTPDNVDDHEDLDAVLGDEESTDTVVCPECGADVYEDADQCPVCGMFIDPGYPRLVGQAPLVGRPRGSGPHRTCRCPGVRLLTARDTI